MILGRSLQLPMGMLLTVVSLYVQYPCECSVTSVYEFPGSQKNQKSVGFESPVSSDPQQVALQERNRSTYGHAAKRDANGWFVCRAICTCMCTCLHDMK